MLFYARTAIALDKMCKVTFSFMLHLKGKCTSKVQYLLLAKQCVLVKRKIMLTEKKQYRCILDFNLHFQLKIKQKNTHRIVLPKICPFILLLYYNLL